MNITKSQNFVCAQHQKVFCFSIFFFIFHKLRVVQSVCFNFVLMRHIYRLLIELLHVSFAIVLFAFSSSFVLFERKHNESFMSQFDVRLYLFSEAEAASATIFLIYNESIINLKQTEIRRKLCSTHIFHVLIFQGVVQFSSGK